MASKHILYLASGCGRRFGSNKLLVEVQGKPLYLHGLQMLSTLEDCTLTVVSRYAAIREKALQMGLGAVDSPESERGASYTIRAGLAALGAVPEGDYLLFVVADQPYLKRASVEKLLALADGKTETACLSCGGVPGNPVLFSAKLIPELLALEGDRGGRAVARNHSCILVETDPEELRDIDFSQDLDRFRN